jgi:hypothetical protein
MATPRQIEANKKNAQRSSGPSETGKSRSRRNALKHGLAAEVIDVEAASPEFLERRAKWGTSYQLDDEAAEWALDRTVAASLRIEHCERAFDRVVEDSRERARLAWDQDRAVEAAAVAARLSTDPVLASRQLETSRAGVVLLLGFWDGLVEAARSPEGWSESHASQALDLLGVHRELRSGRTPIDDPEGSDHRAYREALALDEIDRLAAIRDEVMNELDELDQIRAMTGDPALLSKPAQLILRYERDAWKRYRESIKEVRDRAAAKPEAPASPVLPSSPLPPRPVPAPSVLSPEPEPEPELDSEEDHRPLMAEAKAYLASIGHPLATSDLADEAWIEEFERHCLAMGGAPFPVTERTQFSGPSPNRAQTVAPERTRSVGSAREPAGRRT